MVGAETAREDLHLLSRRGYGVRYLSCLQYFDEAWDTDHTSKRDMEMLT